MKLTANQSLRMILAGAITISVATISARFAAAQTPTPTLQPSTTETPVVTTQTVPISVTVTPVVTISITPSVAQTAAQSAARLLNATGVNLLANPGHEHPGANFAGRSDLNVTWNWNPFWEDPPAGADANNPNYRTPEFSATFARDNPERVRSGAGTDRWRNTVSVNKKAGIMQYVADLPVGTAIRFTSWLQLWSNDDTAQATTSKGGDLKVRLCIDQDGGPRDLTDSNLVCSEWKQPYDKWEQLSVDGIAKNSVANAIIWSTADTPILYNDVYVDESCFEILPAASDKGICAGAGLIETGSKVLPLPANVGDIKISAEEQAKLARVQAQATAATPAASALTAPTIVTPSLVVNARVSLNIREQPSQTATIANNVRRGTVLTVTAKSEDSKWFQVDLDGQTGWVLASLTLPNAAAQAMPTIK